MTTQHTFSPHRSVLAVGVLSISVACWSAVPVEDSSMPRGGEQGHGQSQEPYSQQGAYAQQGGPGAPAASGGTGRLSELFYQLEVMQREVQDLRGMVEEQGHRLDRLAKDQQEQYLDLDRRMQALRGGGSGGTSSPAAAGSAATPASGDTSSEPEAGMASASGGERDAYTAAFQLMKDRQFDPAVDAFNQLIIDYPNGAYTPNAFYWLGEVYLAQEQFEKARQSFAQVVNLYPDHQKVPDALYKLGVVYHRLGDVQRAREYLNRVIKEYPQSSAAGLAQNYLAEL